MPDDTRWHRTVPSEAVAPGAIVRARIGRRPVLVARLAEGDAVAFAPTCPHQQTPLEEASFWEGNIRCRRHQYLYDPRTGENVAPARTSRPENLWKLKPGYLPTYPVEERDGWVWVGEDANPPPEAYDPALEEPPSWTGPSERPVEEEPEPPATRELPPRAVRVHLGASFELRLPTNPLPGHSWEVEVAGSRLDVVEEELLPADPPRWRVRLTARVAGHDEVVCAFRRPWDVEPSEVRRYLVEIVAPTAG